MKNFDDLTENKFLILFYLVPFLGLLLGNLNFIISYLFSLPVPLFILFIVANLLFLLSLSSTIGNILISLVFNYFEDKEKSKNLIALYSKNNNQFIKPLIIILIFSALYIYLTMGIYQLSTLTLLVMLIPSVAIFINSKFFINDRVRFIKSHYVYFKNRSEHIISFFLNTDDEIVFLTEEGKNINTNVNQTAINFEDFSQECKANGLNAK